MKKTFITLCLFTAVGSIKAQQITTPANTPLSIQTYVDVVGGLSIKKDSSFKISGKSVLSTKGTGNVLVGEDAGNYSLTNPAATGQYNLLLGGNAGYTNLSGSQNTCIGFNSGFNNRTGSFNLFLGTSSGLNTNSASANGNVFIGVNSGTDNVTGSNNTIIGTNASLGAQAGLTFATAIGAEAVVTASSSIVLGKVGTNVGIGTSAPTAKLEIGGTATNKSGIKNASLLGAGVASGVRTGGYLTVDNTGEIVWAITGATARVGVDEVASDKLTDISNQITAINTKLSTSSFSDNWSLANGVLRSKNKSRVVIGEGITSMPEGYSFYVADGILTEKVKVAIKGTDEWADYVFGKNYNRMSLTDVAKYIEKNNHLPNVPSAAEMVQNGNDLHKTDVKLLEKIEELTLYMIEMKKENEQLKKDVDSLKKRRK